MTRDPAQAGPAERSTLQTLLADAGVPYRIVEHAATYHARDDAEAVGVPAARVAKTVVTVERGIVRLAVVPASRRLDIDRMRALIGASARLRPATEQEAAAIFPQFEVGAVPPLGRLLGVEEIIDQLLLEQPEILASAGDHRHGLLVDPMRLADTAGARVADIASHWNHDDRRHRFGDAGPLGRG